MLTKKRILLALCVVGLSSYAIRQAESQDGGQQKTAADIPFNDPAHTSFFNLQSFLVQHGKDGFTPGTWQALPPSERAKKVADGEAFLTQLHSALSSKDKLTAQEEAMSQVVWGKGNGALNSTHNAAAAKKVSATAKQVNGMTEDLGQLFDGSRNSSKDIGAVGAAGGDTKHVATSPTPTVRPLDEAPVPPARSDDGNAPFKNALPLAAGVIIAGGGSCAAYYALKKKASKDGSTASASTAALSPVEDQITALNKIAADPQRWYDFRMDPAAYAVKNNVTFDPKVVTIVQSALAQHDQEITRLVSSNEHHMPGDFSTPVAGTAEAVTNLVMTAAAVVAACAAVAML